MNRSTICQQLRKRLSIITLATFLASLAFLFFTYLDPEARAVRGIARLGRPASRPTETSSMFGDVIEALYKPQIHPITAENFTDETGQVFRNSGEPFYKKGLGKRVLILDADTRPMNKDGELLSSGGMKWPHPDPISSGMLSHYLYSRIHGYDYQLIQVTRISDWSNTWSKIPAIKHALMSYDLVVFLDQDAVFRYPALPLEWLLNHWRHTNETALLLAADPDKAFNTDPHGSRYLNTGFIVAQNSTRTHRLIDAWLRCPFGAEYSGCRRFAHQWPHEQAALVSFVHRYAFTRPEDVRAVPCAEANGSPWTAAEHGCRGALVRHLWRNGKGRQPDELVDQVLRYLMPALYSDFRNGYYKTLAMASAPEKTKSNRGG
ncbi:Glycosyltransferase, family GT34 [Beauveria bassiana ARSEF 2860]|uniref:Glycosyltransferase, family GT34 n=1 Tax=Beauveria bassiana (strain ARSEF 2860) TaxID=655819 RepID=J4UPK3_BEAB2|nr:Glycosyltransferase, family GT34 [Beauveria bassiana ARSEF 2860]EJP67142.1 Glycosyltransferase, family GT34 [Beauveria bassiana ARSEF 2860]